MEKIVYGSKMKKVDNYTIDVIGIPSMVLMERAAFSVFSYVKEHIHKNQRILCICGVGNNGADGVALARMLCLEGYQADVLIIGNEEKATSQWKQQKEIAIACHVSITYIDSFISDLQVTTDKNEAYANISQGTNSKIREFIATYHVIADAIFGIGLTRNIEGVYKDVINVVNEIRQQEKVKVYALDVPSGLCADTGRVMGTAVNADITFTFGAIKTGLLLYKGRDYSGKVIKNDIGFPQIAYESALEKEELVHVVQDEDICKIISRKQHTNKGTYGKILVIGGSENVYGAVYFSTMAACKMGCGLVRVITHQNNRDLIYDKLPEVMINAYDTGTSEASLKSMVEEAITWADVVAIGPGMSMNDEAKLLLKYAMCLTKVQDKPIIIDADGLNIIAKNYEYAEYYHKKTIITPHIGEMARIIGKSSVEIAGDIIGIAGEYARINNINVIQKDATTVILGIESSEDKCNNRVCINTSGNAGMATGGSGDVLTGIVAAVLAGGVDVKRLQEYEDASDKELEEIYLASSIGVYIHGLAGDMASNEMGETSMTATDILNMIPKLLAKYR